MDCTNNFNPGPIPNHWLHCPRKSLGLIADKFFVCKTPLSNKFNAQVPLECRFNPKMVFSFKLKHKLGLWIDLTNTSRFYDKEEIEQSGCKYIKLQCRGHGETPSEEQKNYFVSLVDQFIKNNPLEAIVVHCTHGFNRSGFLIVSYLVEKMDCSLESALTQFSNLRPPGIYKDYYLEELYKIYDDIDDCPPPPELPDWHKESDDSNSNETSVNNKNTKAIPKFMDGVPGVSLFTEHPRKFKLQQKIIKMCHAKGKGFPGSQPVSMDTTNIHLLSQKPYRVSWKADGTRYMMLIEKQNEVFFFDRDNTVFRVHNFKFPSRTDLSRHITNTLVDGEMVIDKVDGKDIPRYLIYDIIHFEDKDLTQLPFYPNRLDSIEYEIIRPRNYGINKGFINKSLEPFSIRSKGFWDVIKASSFFSESFTKMLSHEPDGLIFQPSKEPYISGRCDDVLKWKPLSLNSVDFKLKIVIESGVGLVPKKVGNLYVGQLDKPFGTIKVTKAIKDLDNKIIECKYENNQWVFMRERTDKSFPNAYTTAMGVCNSIRDPITKERLLEYIEHNHYIDDRNHAKKQGFDDELMPPPKMKRTF